MKKDYNSLIGRKWEFVKIELIEERVDFRVMREDEINYMGTTDLNLNRVNIQIDDGIVTSVNIG